jgi:hypothetical protein
MICIAQLQSLDVLLENCKAEMLLCKSIKQKTEVRQCCALSCDIKWACSICFSVAQMEQCILEISAAQESLILQPGVQLNPTIKRIRQWNFKVRS